MTPRRRTATRADHERFCMTEGWKERTRATGRRGTHHVSYELTLPDGRVLRTRISHPVDRTDYGPAMWAHILRDQLDVDDTTFWACVDDGLLPVRDSSVPDGDALPAGVVLTLVREARLPEAHVRAMTKEQAVARLAQYYTTGR